MGAMHMYASIRRYRTKPGAAKEVLRRVEEEFAGIVAEASGFVAYYALAAGPDVVASVSVFEDRAGAEESNGRAAAWVDRSIAPLVAGPPEITAGEVEVVRTAPAAAGHS
jgi:heme-degrading monooxygenase HmoA